MSIEKGIIIIIILIAITPITSALRAALFVAWGYPAMKAHISKLEEDLERETTRKREEFTERVKAITRERAP